MTDRAYSTYSETDDGRQSEKIIYLIHCKKDGTPDQRYGPKEKVKIRKSTRMECLYTIDEIQAVYDVFKKRVDAATTLAKEMIARRNITMFVCAMNIGLRGEDFCSLKWSDIIDDDWTFNNGEDFVPQKTEKYHKHIEISWSSDFEAVLSKWLTWKNNYLKEQELDDYIFSSQKGGYVASKEWWKIMEIARKEAGIKQKIGTHGLRKTMVNQYIMKADDKSEALVEASIMLGHSDLRTTQVYSCITRQRIQENKERLAVLGDKINQL